MRRESRAAELDDHPDDATLETWRSEADRWARYGVMPADETRAATQRIATLIDALRAARSANVELGRVTLETARELERRLEAIKSELSALNTRAARVDAARAAVFGRGGSLAGVTTSTPVEIVEDDAPHGPVCVSLDAGCPDCLRLQRAARRKAAH
jgi:hypothetical protein